MGFTICMSDVFASSPSLTECKDKNDNCGYWSSIGECQKNPTYMHRNCRKSCRKRCYRVTHSRRKCKEDQYENCRIWAARKMCEIASYKTYMMKHCPTSCNACSV